MNRRDINHIQKLIDMRKPNLDDYDNGHRDEPEVLRFPGVFPETKEQRYKRRMRLFFEIWEERKNEDGNRYSEISGDKLPSKFSNVYFEHLLERNKYPHLEFEKENIVLCTAEEQEQKTKGFPSENHKKLIEKAKKKYGV